MSTTYQEFTYGDIAALRGNSDLVVTSPRGVVTRFPVSVHRVQRFRVEELGTWTYEWGDGINGWFVVVPPPVKSSPISESSNPPVLKSTVQASPKVKTAGEKFFAFF